MVLFKYNGNYDSPGISKQTVDKLEQVAGVTSVEQYHNNEKRSSGLICQNMPKASIFGSSRNIGGISE